MYKRILHTIIWIILPLAITAQVKTTTTSSGNWNVGGNWSNGVPSINDSAFVEHPMSLNVDLEINTGAYYNVNSPGMITDPSGGLARLITLKNNGQMVVDGDVTIEGLFNSRNTSALSILPCDTLEVGGMLVENSSSFLVSSCAVLIINGDLNLENNLSNTVNGFIRVNGDVTASNGASITGSGSLSASGSVTINNTSSIFGSTTDCPDSPVDCVYGNGIVLPVEWTSFTADLADEGVKLNWSVATETNNDYFIVEQSFDNEDWNEIGRVEGKGTSNVASDYEFLDQSIIRRSEESVYYRITQVDFDLSESHTNVESVDLSQMASRNIIVFPNPANDQIFIKSEADISILTLRSSTGQLIQEYPIFKGMAAVPTKDIDEGMYFLQFLLENGSIINKAVAIQH